MGLQESGFHNSKLRYQGPWSSREAQFCLGTQQVTITIKLLLLYRYLFVFRDQETKEADQFCKLVDLDYQPKAGLLLYNQSGKSMYDQFLVLLTILTLNE